jgi:phosphatidylethanolamine/phosphatidyl-N-methylethanolamine N-methyltransferase
MDRFIRNIKKTGAISPCSQEVARVLTRTVNVASAKTVVELGSGTGAVTKRIAAEISPHALLLALEVHPHFVIETKRACPRAFVYHDTAENLKKYLQKHGKENCDSVISTLPWTIFSFELQKKILDAVYDALAVGGGFSTICYTFSNMLPRGRTFQSLLRKKFRDVQRTKAIWLNFPPVYVYHCHR